MNKFNLENCTNVKLNLNSFSLLRLTRCCTLRRAKNTPTPFVNRSVNRKWMCCKPGKERHGTSHHAKAIYQI